MSSNTLVRAMLGLVAIAGVALMTHDLARHTDAIIAAAAYRGGVARPAPASPAVEERAPRVSGPTEGGLDLIELTTHCGTGSGPGHDLLDWLTARYLTGVPLAYAVFVLFRRVQDAGGGAA